MPEPNDHRPETPDQPGISLDELSQAFAQAMAGPREQDDELDEGSQPAAEAVEPGEESPIEAEKPGDDDPCPLCPRTILEAMLFVGNQENESLSGIRAAELMRGVEPDEIADLIDELNCRYAQNGCPYRIVSQGVGHRLELRRPFYPVRNKFYGRVREAQLSQAAIDLLAIVAYRQPLTSEEVSGLRGTPSSHLLAQLVRRRLLRIERPEGKRKPVHYFTTDRFLELFGLEGLDDLPQAEELQSQ